MATAACTSEAAGLPRRALGATGLTVSALGFGASPLGNVFGDVREADARAAVAEALRLGINFFDVSPFYGATLAETVLGRCLQGVPRDAFVLSTKVGRYGQDEFDFSAERVRASVHESLQRLQLDFIDIIQCHDIEFVPLDVVVTEALPALKQLKDEGRVRAIGITGLPLKVFRQVLDSVEPGTVDVVLSYCHNSLNDTALLDMLPFLQEKGVGVISASPLSMGLLTEQGPPPWHPAPAHVKEACAAAASLCKARKQNIAKVALQFALQDPRVASTLVGMSSIEQVRENVEAAAEYFQRRSDTTMIKELEDILKPVKNVSWFSGLEQNNQG